MPKALLICREENFSWMSPLGILHPLDLRILGKTLAERWALYLRSQGIDEVRIMTDTPWDPKGIWEKDQVRTFPRAQALPLVLASQKIFWEKSECLILQAPVLLNPACQTKLQPEGHSMEPLLLYRSKAQALDLGPWRPLTSASHFYIASLEILEKERPTSLTPLPTEGKPPVFFDENVHYKDGEFGPFTVLGPGTRVGKGAQIKSTVIYGQVALGDRVEFREKLILGTTVITPGTENKSLITDPKIIKAL